MKSNKTILLGGSVKVSVPSVDRSKVNGKIYWTWSCNKRYDCFFVIFKNIGHIAIEYTLRYVYRYLPQIVKQITCISKCPKRDKRISEIRSRQKKSFDSNVVDVGTPISLKKNIFLNGGFTIYCFMTIKLSLLYAMIKRTY